MNTYPLSTQTLDLKCKNTFILEKNIEETRHRDILVTSHVGHDT